MISAGERKGRTIGLKYMAWHSVQLLYPCTRQSTQHGRENKKAYRVNKYQ